MSTICSKLLWKWKHLTPVALLIVVSPVYTAAFAQTSTQDCLDCHDDAEMESVSGRFIGVLAGPFRSSIHGDLDCTDCHTQEADYDDEPHFERYVRVDCAECHEDASRGFSLNYHALLSQEGKSNTPRCTDCHALRGDPHRIQSLSDWTAEKACVACHEGEMQEFVGSAHADLVSDGEMGCVSCHRTHQTETSEKRCGTSCGSCHDVEIAGYQRSAHHFGRIGGPSAGIDCADCHGSHGALAVTDPKSPVHPGNIPDLCGRCHAGQSIVTENFVKMPISLPNYLESVHGQRWKEGKSSAVCTDCHGVHDLRHAQDPKALTYRTQLSATCGKCHTEVAAEYDRSVHGQAVAMGLEDSPTCTDCHDEHLIKPLSDPSARVSPEHRAKELCGDCHTDPELLAKYGIARGVVGTYLDSYHGWAVDRGSELVATCTDCHNVHEIRSHLDPASSIHPSQVVETCKKCHPGANAVFAQSYTHESALQARGVHGWARLVYIALIAFVLGGMAIHNFIVARYELRKHFERLDREAYVQRWRQAERIQHIALLTSFIGLAVTGFALRFPDSWWVHLIGLGGHESVRANLHRVLAVILTALAVFHTMWILSTRRGRWALREMTPRYWDVGQFVQNMAFHLGWRRERPAFREFDYTQKAEYWAVVWGTVVMAITGFVLWFPTVATQWLPSWIVRVSEVVHFYEAILAVSAIVIWHFFYVIFMPSEYPMSTVWINGRMPAKEWREMHRGAVSARADHGGETPDPTEDATVNTGPPGKARPANGETPGQR